MTGSTMILAMLTPMEMGLALVAVDLTLAALGPKWAPVFPVLQAFALIAALNGILAGVDSLLVIQGRPRFIVARVSAALVVRLGVAACAVWKIGMFGAIWGALAGVIVRTGINFYGIRPTMGVRISEFAISISRSPVSAGAMAAVVVLVQRRFVLGGTSAGAILRLATATPAGCVTCMFTHLACCGCADCPMT